VFPVILDTFVEGEFEYLVIETPQGRSLWDAWDDPEADSEKRFGWLKQIAEALHELHGRSALLEALRPDIVVVTSEGQARLTDVSDLLPLPVPPNPPLRASLYSAPELITSGPNADARADLFSFGAMLYALHVGRELTEMDFDVAGAPKPFIPRFPDIHPHFGRLITKTFRREPEARFPTEEAVKEDATGFTDLIRTLEVCQRTLDNVRLEIASWTTTGMVRTGNEDAFALLHSAESRQDDLEECALVLLADGMGGYESGEVAAAMAIQVLRRNLLRQPLFYALAGDSPFPGDFPRGERPRFDVEACQGFLKEALRDANKQVHAAARTGVGRRGMGCTAEAVFVNGHYVVVGHVGDSRTYHLHEGRLIQLTRDQTLVSRLVELGTLSPEEAETHPRRNELQQAIGGQPDVEPGLYRGRMRPGDWVVVCSDGVSNHVTAAMLKEMLQSEATSAEMAARRLANLVNIEGATDNATVVVIRAT
jgi:serine/threonine protein phosphatase PrpC